MTKQEFLSRLQGATLVSLKFAERYVKDKLTSDFKYNVIFTPLNIYGNADQFDFYPEDEGIIKLNLTDNDVVDLLYRKNKIPVWIDISVLKSSRKSTIFNLLCAGRYSENKEEYYYLDDVFPPFGIKGPTFPIGYKEGEKFWLKKKQFTSIIYFTKIKAKFNSWKRR